MIAQTTSSRTDEETLSSYSVDYSTAQTGTQILPAKAGYHYVIHAININTGGTTDATLTDDDGQLIFKAYFSRQGRVTDSNLHFHLEENKGIKINCGANTSVCLTYHTVRN